MVTRCFEVLQTATPLHFTKQAAGSYMEKVIKICFFYSSKVVTNYSMWMGIRYVNPEQQNQGLVLP